MRPVSEPPRDLPDRIIRHALRHPANLRAFLRQAVPTLADGFSAEQPALLAAAQALQTNVNRQKEVNMLGKSMGETIWEEGWLKGNTEGELRVARQVLRQLMADRFGALSEDVIRRIESTTD